MLSTPGVRAPLLVITRRTASHLADCERVSMRQSTLTLPQRFSRTAWAIRLWSRFTSRSALDQSMVSQLGWCLNALADACRSTICCFSKFNFAFRVSHPQELQRKSAPSRVGPEALSVPLQNGLRFFPDELPDVPSVRLAVTLSVPVEPGQQTAGLPRFVCATDGPVRSPPSTGGRLVRDWSALSPSARPLTLLVPAYSRPSGFQPRLAG